MDWSYFYSEAAPYVKVLSIQHILYLIACGIFVALFIKNHVRVRTYTDKVSKIFLWILLFQQIVLLYGWYVVVTGFDASTALPLHISRVASLLTIVFLLTKRKAFLDIVCYFSIFAFVSLFYPMNVYHFAHVNGISYMVNHLLTMLMLLLGIIGYNWRPAWKSLRNAVIGFSCYFPLALLANALTENGNYFYQTDRPFLKSLTSWQFAALSYGVCVAVFALITLSYVLIAKKITGEKNNEN